jgi:hypothetical protein
MLDCGHMPQDHETAPVRSARDHVALRAGGWLGVLVAALIVQHFVVHRGVILPASATPEGVPPWAWAALFAPELLACFAAGWRLRSWKLVAMYAALATLVREGFFFLLHLVNEPGHETGLASRPDAALTPPIVALAYLAVLVVASLSGREDAQLDRV